MVIELHDICKSYLQGKEQVPVLHHIDLDVAEGEYLAIMGPSGSGKSTLMNIIGLLDQQTSGSYFFDGRDMTQCSDNQLSDIRNQKIGFVFQNFNLLPRQSVLENVALPLTFRGEPRKERIKKADRMLDLVSLEKHKKHLPNQLSGGQQQRVSVARALVNDPKIIFADEPTGALDSHTSQDVMRLMQRLVREQKRTLVMVTHDRSQAEYADRVLEIIDGKIVHITENRRKEENERA